MNRPWAARAKAVVMPQVGQGWLSATAQAHAGRPSCVCVPCPAPDGSSHAAVARTAAQPALTINAVMRDPSAACGRNDRAETGVAADTANCIVGSVGPSGRQPEGAGFAGPNEKGVPAQRADAGGLGLPRTPEPIGQLEQVPCIGDWGPQVENQNDPQADGWG